MTEVPAARLRKFGFECNVIWKYPVDAVWV
jgi:hypothetical protein